MMYSQMSLLFCTILISYPMLYLIFFSCSRNVTQHFPCQQNASNLELERGERERERESNVGGEDYERVSLSKRYVNLSNSIYRTGARRG